MLAPFFAFYREKREGLKKQYPEISGKEMSKITAQVWREMEESEKQPFVEEVGEEKKCFDRKFKGYFDLMGRMERRMGSEVGNDSRT